MTSKISDGMDAIPGVFCLARKSLGQASDLGGRMCCASCLPTESRVAWVGCRRDMKAKISFRLKWMSALFTCCL